MKENIFINIIKQTLTASSCYIGDDTAYIKEKDIVITQDTLVEDVHFRQKSISPYQLAQKAVVVNLSDIAAAGAIPSYMVISLSLPSYINENYIKEFYQGINDICSKYNLLTIGGDITGGDKIAISITMLGNCDGIKPSSRSYAEKGDYIIATGEHGSSSFGFQILENKGKFKGLTRQDQEYFIGKHINPSPKFKEGRKIAEIAKNRLCMMDTSDGLADALFKISLASKVSMEIDYKSIPMNDSLIDYSGSVSAATNYALFGGEDYELVATLKPEFIEKLKQAGISFHILGRVTELSTSPTVDLKSEGKTIKLTKDLMDNNAFDHFVKE